MGLRVVDEFGARPEFPSVRVGIHTGPAVERDGFFGAAVNLAARISADAAAGEVLLSQDTLDAAGGELDGVELLAGFGYSRRQVVCERCGSAPTLGERGLQA